MMTRSPYSHLPYSYWWPSFFQSPPSGLSGMGHHHHRNHNHHHPHNQKGASGGKSKGGAVAARLPLLHRARGEGDGGCHQVSAQILKKKILKYSNASGF